MQLKSGLAALVAAAPLAQAAGSAKIQNNCGVPVYLWAVDINRNPGAPTAIAPGSSYSEDYHTLPSGGVSLKLSKHNSLTKITQFEYTLAGGFIWYDGSNVDCQGPACPFYAEGIHMETSNPSCPIRTCEPNTDCNGFYINYNDDWNSLSCSPEADIKFFLCSSDASGGSGDKGGSSPTTSVAPKAPSAVPSSPAALPSAVTSAPAAASSAIHRMEAVEPWHGHGGHRMVKKVKARDAEIDARDLHAHMRRHNHRRSHL